MPRKRTPNLQPCYRISELVMLSDISRGRVVRILSWAGVEPRWVGRQRLDNGSRFSGAERDRCTKLWLFDAIGDNWFWLHSALL